MLPHELYSPKITADWETKIALIAEGKMSETEFMDEFIAFIHDKVREVKEADKGVDFSNEREIVGICPWCGADLWRWEKRDTKSGDVTEVLHYCSNKDSCSFCFGTNNQVITTWTGRKLTEKQLQRLISKGVIVLNCKSKLKAGETFKGKFEMTKRESRGKTYAGVTYAGAGNNSKEKNKK